MAATSKTTRAVGKKTAKAKPPSFNVAYRRSLMTGDAVIEEAARSSIAPGSAQTLIKGRPLICTHRQNRAVKGFAVAAGSEPVTGSDNRNLVEGDIVQTSAASPGVRIAFELAVLPIDSKPAQSGSADAKRIETVIAAILGEGTPLGVATAGDETALTDVATRLAYTLTHAAWAWRNRSLASAIEVRVAWRAHGQGQAPQANELQLADVKSRPLDPADGIRLAGVREQLQPLTQVLHAALAGHVEGARLFVEAWFDIGASMRIFPSQLLHTGKGRAYFQVPGSDHYGLTAEKVANRLRCVDAWHNYPGFEGVSIPIEVLGSNLEYGIDFRPEKKGSLFDLWDKLLQVDDPMAIAEALDAGERRYLMAWFLRGGALARESEKPASTEALTDARPAPTEADTAPTAEVAHGDA